MHCVHSFTHRALLTVVMIFVIIGFMTRRRRTVSPVWRWRRSRTIAVTPPRSTESPMMRWGRRRASVIVVPHAHLMIEHPFQLNFFPAGIFHRIAISDQIAIFVESATESFIVVSVVAVTFFPCLIPVFRRPWIFTSILTLPVDSVLSEGQTGQRADNGEQCDSHLCDSSCEIKVKQPIATAIRDVTASPDISLNTGES